MNKYFIFLNVRVLCALLFLFSITASANPEKCSGCSRDMFLVADQYMCPICNRESILRSGIMLTLEMAFAIARFEELEITSYQQRLRDFGEDKYDLIAEIVRDNPGWFEDYEMPQKDKVSPASTVILADQVNESLLADIYTEGNIRQFIKRMYEPLYVAGVNNVEPCSADGKGPLEEAARILLKRATSRSFERRFREAKMEYLFSLADCPDEPASVITEFVHKLRYVQYVIRTEERKLVTVGVIRASHLPPKDQSGLPKGRMYLHMYGGPIVEVDETCIWTAIKAFHEELEDFYRAAEIAIHIEFYKKFYREALATK
ncbi:hypothetical protein ACWJJH_00605 [Endozoicomonadaceae bacterium StTr2]